MEDKVEISKINLQIGNKEISLTLEQAKELQNILNATFGKTEIVHERPIIIEREKILPWRRGPYWSAEYVSGKPELSLKAGNHSG